MQFLKSAEASIRRLRCKLSPLLYRGHRLHCPVCAHSFSRFLPAGKGANKRPDATCPYCRARERDRLNWLFLQSRPDLLRAGMQLLHVAPEPSLQPAFAAKVGKGYLSADLIRKDVMAQMDVTAIRYPEAAFDAIYCSHVLQDVPDDMQAIAEFYRVLKPGGWAIVNIPIGAELTQEHAQAEKIKAKWDPRPDERVRLYGKDFEQRLAAAGFDVQVLDAALVEPDLARRRHLAIDTFDAGLIHLAAKRS